jgi:hypothetical protein
MTSSYSTDLKLELMVTGENAGTWGDKTNTNLNLIQQAIAGYEAVTITDSATTALVMSDATLSNARNMVIKFATITLTGATTVTIPDGIEKFYIFDCSGITDANNLTIKTVSGSGFSPTTAGAASPKIFAAYSDGTNITEISLNTLGGTIATAQIEAAAITTSLIANDAVTTDKILNANVTTAKIADDNVTTAKIADDAVTADKLANTTVTPGSYTASSITVDAQGRITAASSGAGAANMKYHYFRSGSASGNISAGANVSKTQAFLWGGGGGGGAGDNNPAERGGAGGSGGFGYFVGPVSGPATLAYSVGGGGNGGPGLRSSGNAGGATNFHNFTANAGNGGGPNNPFSNGNSGTAPGAFSLPINSQIFFTNATLGTGGGGGAGPGNSAGTPGQPGGLIVLLNDG